MRNPSVGVTQAADRPLFSVDGDGAVSRAGGTGISLTLLRSKGIVISLSASAPAPAGASMAREVAGLAVERPRFGQRCERDRQRPSPACRRKHIEIVVLWHYN